MRNDAFVDLRGQTDKGMTPYGVNLPVYVLLAQNDCKKKNKPCVGHCNVSLRIRLPGL